MQITQKIHRSGRNERKSENDTVDTHRLKKKKKIVRSKSHRLKKKSYGTNTESND